MIAKHTFKREQFDRDQLEKAGFLLDKKFPNYAVPISGTQIKSYATPEGRVYEQHHY